MSKGSFAASMSLIACLLVSAEPARAQEDDGPVMYVASSTAVLRRLPRADAAAIGKLPINTKLVVRTVSENHEQSVCEMAPETTASDWLCAITDYPVEMTYNWHGWVSRDLLTTQMLTVKDLLARFDALPKDKLAERRKWAERAVALDPLDAGARSRLLGVLSALPDAAESSEAARRSFEAYQAPKPRPLAGGADLVLRLHDNGWIEPMAEIRGGTILMTGPGNPDKVNGQYRKRGNFYHVYVGGEHRGHAVTEAEFNCSADVECPAVVPVRLLPNAGKTISGAGIAVTRKLIQVAPPPASATAAVEPHLRKLAQAWTKSAARTPPQKTTIERMIAGEGRFGIGRLPGGQSFAVGHWVRNSMDSEKYGLGTDDELYEEVLVVANKGPDGKLRTEFAGSLRDSGCGYADLYDLDGDGVDEILLDCAGVEGSYGFDILQRDANGTWSQAAITRN